MYLCNKLAKVYINLNNMVVTTLAKPVSRLTQNQAALIVQLLPLEIMILDLANVFAQAGTLLLLIRPCVRVYFDHNS
jgi:hypothetical protein